MKKVDAHTNTKISDHKSAYLKQENPNPNGGERNGK